MQDRLINTSVARYHAWKKHTHNAVSSPSPTAHVNISNHPCSTTLTPVIPVQHLTLHHFSPLRIDLCLVFISETIIKLKRQSFLNFLVFFHTIFTRVRASVHSRARAAGPNEIVGNSTPETTGVAPLPIIFWYKHIIFRPSAW